GEARTRSDGIRISRNELAVAAPRAVAFVDDRALETARRGIGHRRTEHAVAVPDLVALVKQVPTDAVIQRQLARDLPGVLQEHAPDLDAVVAADVRRAQRNGELVIPVVVGVGGPHAEHAALRRGEPGDTRESSAGGASLETEQSGGVIIQYRVGRAIGVEVAHE